MALMGMESRELVIADTWHRHTAPSPSTSPSTYPPPASTPATPSTPPLDVAAYNVRLHNVADRVTLLKGDLLESLPEPVDVIAANLPYLPTDPYPHAATRNPCGSRWRPWTAAPMASTTSAASSNRPPSRTDSKPHGVILLEMDPEQMDEARSLASESFPDAEITVEPDLSGQERVLSVSLAGGYDEY